MVQQQGVSVVWRCRDLSSAQRAAGATHILHHHLLAQILAHRRRDKTGHRVGRAAGRERHHDGDGLGRIVLRHNGNGAEC